LAGLVLFDEKEAAVDLAGRAEGVIVTKLEANVEIGRASCRERV
jgi:hypothetical protein